MKKQAFRKDIVRTVLHGKQRFCSILVITALGVSMLTGLRAACEDLLRSADAYMDEQDLYDIQIQSTLGLTEDDVAVLAALDGVETAEGGYSETVNLSGDSHETVSMQVISESGMSEPYLIEGTLPASADEIAVTNDYLTNSQKEIGDTVTIEEILDEDEDDADTDADDAGGTGTADADDAGRTGTADADDEEAGDTDEDNGDEDDEDLNFLVTEYTITAVVSDPANLNNAESATAFRNVTTTDYTFFITADAYDSDVFTSVFLTVSGAAALNCYSDAYENAVAAVVDEIEEEIKERRETERTDEVLAEAWEEIDDAEEEMNEEFADADEEIADAKKELEDARQELDDGWAEYYDGLAEVEDGEEELADGEAELADGEEELADGEEELADGKAELADGIAELKKQESEAYEQIASARAELEESKQEVEDGWEELTAGEAALAASEAELEESAAALAEARTALEDQTALYGKELLADAWAELEAGEAELAAGQAELAAAKKELKKNRKQLTKAEQQIEDGEAELDEQEAAAEKEFADAWATIYESQAELEDAEKEIEDARAELEDARAELEDARTELSDARAELADALTELEDGEAEYADGKAELEEEVEKYEKEKADAIEELEEAKEEVNDIEDAKWYVTDRSNLSGFTNVDSDSGVIEQLGLLFPFIFLAVAILISLTALTRMVEEERGLIGTYKALGFTNTEIRRKYMIFAVAACLAGCVVGVIGGFIIMPLILFYIFDSMYSIPAYYMAPELLFGIMGFAFFLGGTILATGLACRRALKQQAAILMRPRTPKAGSNVFLERIPFIWKRLSFLNKVTMRNLFRYKKRLLMTVLGILGCTALLVCSFALMDSLSTLMDDQYDEICHYDAMAVADEEDILPAYLEQDEDVTDYMTVRIDTITIENDGTSENIQLIVIPDETADAVPDYLTLESESGETLTPNDDGILVTINTSIMLGFAERDTVSLQDLTLEEGEAAVSGIVVNYLGNYIFMTETVYESLFGHLEENGALVNLSDACADTVTWADTLAHEDNVSSVTATRQLKDEFSQAFALVNAVVYMLLVMAAALAFIVLFTLSATNISERERELATIKVLGFYDREVHLYINKETVILTILGIIPGLIVGTCFGHLITAIMKMPSVYFAVTILPRSYLLSACFALVFAFIVILIMNRVLNAIDQVEALKSIE